MRTTFCDDCALTAPPETSVSLDLRVELLRVRLTFSDDFEDVTSFRDGRSCESANPLLATSDFVFFDSVSFKSDFLTVFGG